MVSKKPRSSGADEWIINHNVFCWLRKLVQSDIYHHVCQFSWHHAHLHTTCWLFEVDCFVQRNILVLLHYSIISIAKIDKFQSFFLDLFVCMKKIYRFKSLDAHCLLEMLPISYFFDSDDFYIFENFGEILFFDYRSRFDDTTERGNLFRKICIKYEDTFFWTRNIFWLNVFEFCLADLWVFA